MLRDFTAIDFETANRYPTSACSIGIVVVQDGEITEEFSHLIKPEPYYFNKKFIEIHGITPVMVKDAPSFYDLWGVAAWLSFKNQRDFAGRIFCSSKA